jgi:hypothetical protein
MLEQQAAAYRTRGVETPRLEEKGCNDCGNHEYQGSVEEEKRSDSRSIENENRGNSTKLSLVLIASLLICCALPAIAVSAGAGIAAYSFLYGRNLILIISSILLLIIAATTLNFYHRKRKAKTIIQAWQKEQPGEK